MQVRGEAFIDRRVEGHLAGAVDDDVEVVRERRDVVEVALDDRDPASDERIDRLSAVAVPVIVIALKLVGIR